MHTELEILSPKNYMIIYVSILILKEFMIFFKEFINKNLCIFLNLLNLYLKKGK